MDKSLHQRFFGILSVCMYVKYTYLFLKEDNEEFKGKVDEVSRVKTMPECKIEQCDAL